MKSIRMLFMMVVTMLSTSVIAQTTSNKAMKRKVLFVITSTGVKGNSGLKTGYYLSEVAHPWKVLVDAGYEIDFVSPKGGESPIDGFTLDDPVNKLFWENKEYKEKIIHSMKPSEVDPSQYKGIYYAGGHGAMWDFPDNAEISAIATKIYEAGGIVGSVCHGPSGLINIKLSNDKYLIDGKHINSFTNKEEKIVGQTDIVPFSLETELRNHGAIYEESDPWQVHVVVDQRVITGQNPQSATAVGLAMANTLSQIK